MITQAKANKVKVCIITITNKGRRDESNGDFRKSILQNKADLLTGTIQVTLQTILINHGPKSLQMFLFMCTPTHTEHVSAAPAICPNTGRRERPPQSRVAKGKDAGSGKEREMWRRWRRRESGARGKKAQPGKSDYTGHHVSTTSYPTSETQHTYNKLPSLLCWHSHCTEFRIQTASFSMNHNTSQSAAWS